MPSPLEEASPLSLQDYMDMDPLELIKDDSKVDAIVAELRAMRERWALAEKKKPKAQAITGTLTLEDLGLKQ